MIYDPLSDDIVFRTWVLFHQAPRTVYNAASKRLRPAGVSLEQALLLFVLSKSPCPPNRAEIAQVLFRRPHTVTALLNGMQRAGLITRIRDDKNYKVRRVVMTEKGKEVFKQTQQTQLVIDLTSCLSRNELRQLSSILQKLRDVAVGELEQSPPSRDTSKRSSKHAEVEQ